jgi:hypothetical protein
LATDEAVCADHEIPKSIETNAGQFREGAADGLDCREGVP